MKNWDQSGQTALGIEFGSTRIKAVLIGPDYQPVASGVHDWDNSFENGLWTYGLDAVWAGIQDAYAKLAADVQNQFGTKLETVGSIGISGMMHGYLPFDVDGRQLVPFRTWRNTTTGQAATILTEAFHCNIPQRWSIAHLYQAILNQEEHVNHIAFLTTLAGYVHWQFTGRKVLGIGDASGMFPIDGCTHDFNSKLMAQFEQLTSEYHLDWSLRDILPDVLDAGMNAGQLTAEGAKLLDPTGILKPGIPLCPPEGDAGTGMTATNSITERTGNVSAGTSVFAMVVLTKELSQVHTELDMVMTPTGKPVAMVHCNNCTGDLDAWMKLFGEVLGTFGVHIAKPQLYDDIYRQALEADADAGGLLHYNYYSGEVVTNIQAGYPLFTRLPNADFNLKNFIRSLLYSAMATLRIGMNILTEQENVELTQLIGHGGLFKTENVGQRLMSAALNVPVAVMETAGEGGAWGIALLAAYMRRRGVDETLDAFLADKVFVNAKYRCISPNADDRAGFTKYMDRYTAGLAAERALQGLS